MTSGGDGSGALAPPLRIAGVIVDPPLVLGPMAGTTGRVYRLLCRRGGAGLVCSEMISINGIVRDNERTFRMMRTFEGEHPVSMQLFGSDPAIMADAVPAAEAAGADLIDINMGCSVPKVRRGGAGVALTRQPERAAAVTAAAAGAASVPVTVKMRAGMTEDDDSYVDTARGLQDAGAAAVSIHARAASQGFSGRADWSHIRRLVDALDVPVIGNGDVTAPEDAPRMMRETGCRAVMIARGAWGRPWLFARAAAALRGQPIPPEPGAAGRLGVALLHAQMLVLDLEERIALHQMRTQMHYYVRGLPGASHFRRRVNRVSALDELRELVEGYVAALRAGEGSAVGESAFASAT
ncbi:MAG: tRNA dihydrouridine synthase DusB [Armatimonadota bacterium]